MNDGDNNGQAAWAKKKEERERERPNDGNNNGQLCIATPPRVVHAKPPGPILMAISRTPGPMQFLACCNFLLKEYRT